MTTLYRANCRVSYSTLSYWVRATDDVDAANKIAAEIKDEVRRVLGIEAQVDVGTLQQTDIDDNQEGPTT